ncbi:hypothetical protein [Sphingomonas sp.]|uniref:hypothetical protein n=1 Tax=Sphingomonas sp. TaxID=28214 RepID=UPI003AFF9ABF
MEKQTALLLIGNFALVIPLSLGLALWFVTRLRRRSDQPASPGEAGVTMVPVRSLQRRYRFLGAAQNGISPRLEVAPDGLRFKVFKPDRWAFADITRVHFFPLPFVTRLEVRSRSAGRLYIDLADKTRARDFLRLLPPTLAYTPRARSLRDDHV